MCDISNWDNLFSIVGSEYNNNNNNNNNEFIS